ncbi:MAG: hypothetical protein R3D02_11910 [Hyphomicrobiales bacterium]
MAAGWSRLNELIFEREMNGLAMSSLLELKLAARNNPTLFDLFWRRQEQQRFRRRVVRRGDDAVIEGYPRSANTFATYAFLDAASLKYRRRSAIPSIPGANSLARNYGIRH